MTNFTAIRTFRATGGVLLAGCLSISLVAYGAGAERSRSRGMTRLSADQAAAIMGQRQKVRVLGTSNPGAPVRPYVTGNGVPLQGMMSSMAARTYVVNDGQSGFAGLANTTGTFGTLADSGATTGTGLQNTITAAGLGVSVGAFAGGLPGFSPAAVAGANPSITATSADTPSLAAVSAANPPVTTLAFPGTSPLPAGTPNAGVPLVSNSTRTGRISNPVRLTGQTQGRIVITNVTATATNRGGQQ